MDQTQIDQLDWAKGDGLLPAIIQDALTRDVLMLGYMNPDALLRSVETGMVTFFSRSKQRLWTKGETSGNTLKLLDISFDCDADTILVQVIPAGPVCHTGTRTCFGDEPASNLMFLDYLGTLIASRHAEMPQDSYTTSLFAAGKARIAQKVGEEGVELALARMKDDTAEMTNEAADLLYHMMILLEDAGLNLADVVDMLRQRHV